MRSALTISLVLHLLISIIAFNWVSFRKVDYIPRQVYNVTLVTPAVAETPPARVEPPRQEAPPEPEPEPEPEEEEEMPPPPEKPKPVKPKPKPSPKKTVPRTDIEKPAADPQTDAEPTEPADTGEMTLDTEDFPFAYYINRMRRKIAAHWRVPAGSQGEDRFCRVYFRVHRDGSVSDVAVEESSGLFMFDNAAQRSVLQSAPMPPLPREFSDNYLGVHFSFAFRERR